jgi:hydroxyacid-oxoacid transhydrogenase
MALTATMAGLGFGNAGVHIPHANAYPIAGRVKDFRPDGYPQDEPIVPHGMAVSLTAPEAFRFTFEARPGRHVRIYELACDEDHRSETLQASIDPRPAAPPAPHPPAGEGAAT